MQAQPLDILFALKAINLAPGLKNNDRAIGAALLDHYNRKTTRCDPGLKRIAKLLNLSTRTVIRSMPRIEAAGLFRRIRHGGPLNRNRYEPNWQRFREIEAEWSARMKADAPPAGATNESSGKRPSWHLLSDKPVTQTCPSNLSKETCERSLPKKEELRVEAGSNKVGLSNSRIEAARVEAERRWNSDLHEQFGSLPLTYGEIIQALDPAIQSTATDAEMKRRGAGLGHILKHLRIPV